MTLTLGSLTFETLGWFKPTWQEDEAGGKRDPTADAGPGQCRHVMMGFVKFDIV